jgi:hypothetical protein
MEQYFEGIARLEGYEEFEREAWGFKVGIQVFKYIDQVLKTCLFWQHDRLNVERRMTECADSKQQAVKTSDVARLMELFQSSLLKYWEFQPVLNITRNARLVPARVVNRDVVKIRVTRVGQRWMIPLLLARSDGAFGAGEERRVVMRRGKEIAKRRGWRRRRLMKRRSM